MGRWLERAKTLETKTDSGDNRDNRDNRDGRGDQGSFVPNVPGPSPRNLLMSWDKGVASLDPDKPLGGYPRDRWLRIIRDCNRLLNEFGRGAATMGWTAEDLFSFSIGGAASDDLGGLIWRLDGGRILFMDGERAAYRWPFSDQTSRFARGYIGALSGQRVPVWELAV